ncbi:MAG: preprotein translocase subunit SecY, partial [Candidatus Methanofastidiosia archaeon]
SLFIAAGVSKDIIWKSLSPLRPDNPTEFIGAVVDFIHSVIVGVPQFTRPALPDILELSFTLVVFFIVVYAESMRIEIPLSYGRFRGVRGRFPIRFIYASNIPVILTVAVFQSTTVFGRLLTNRFHWDWLARFDPQSNLPSSGILYYISSPGGLSNVRADPVHASIYLIIMIASCIFWAYMWIEMTNMGPKAVAKRLQQSGMQIPGFRRDIRIVEKVLSRYIPKVTIMGGAFIGLLAAFADFTNALGTGTGILLTVGIVYRMYEELMREQVSEMFPALRGFLEG